MENLDKDIELVSNMKNIELKGKVNEQYIYAKIPEEYLNAIENVLADRKMWKKIAEFLAKKVSETGECYFISPTHCEKYKEKSCDECIVQCILEWAKSEALKDE